jgi:hypothetical protein
MHYTVIALECIQLIEFSGICFVLCLLDYGALIPQTRESFLFTIPDDRKMQEVSPCSSLRSWNNISDHFQNKGTSRGGSICWPPRSPELYKLMFIYIGYISVSNFFREEVLTGVTI